MNDITGASIKIKNIESPFTELFSILKRYKNLPSGLPTLVYRVDELK